MVIAHGAVATEAIGHVTDAGATKTAKRLYDAAANTAQHIADITVFAATGPWRLTANKILVRPTAEVC
jgi:NADP-dependent 3-hydroxy acid dehydrogenase YdfG